MRVDTAEKLRRTIRKSFFHCYYAKELLLLQPLFGKMIV